MMIGEVKKWAKSFGYEVKNKDGGYIWKHNDCEEYLISKNVDELATDIFNHLTKGKWKDYQEKFRNKQLDSQQHAT